MAVKCLISFPPKKNHKDQMKQNQQLRGISYRQIDKNKMDSEKNQKQENEKGKKDLIGR